MIWSLIVSLACFYKFSFQFAWAVEPGYKCFQLIHRVSHKMKRVFLRKVIWCSFSLGCFYNFQSAGAVSASIQVPPANNTGTQSIPQDEEIPKGSDFDLCLMFLQPVCIYTCCSASIQVPSASVQVLEWWIEIPYRSSENSPQGFHGGREVISYWSFLYPLFTLVLILHM